jgi:hypothetical protein
MEGRSIRFYALGAAAGVAAFMIGIVGLVDGLGRVGLDPPPPMTNSLCVDQKMRMLKYTKPEPTVMAVGSSVTWRNLDSPLLQEYFGPTERVINGGFCGTNVDETYYATDYYLTRYPTIRTVVSLMAQIDFKRCTGKDNPFFDTSSVDHYLDWPLPEIAFYFLYFDPFSFGRNVMIFRKPGEFPPMNKFGDLPMMRTGDLNADYPNYRIDPKCLDSLHAFALHLKQRGVRFIAVLMPTSPRWRARNDPAGDETQELRSGFTKAMVGTSAITLDGYVWGLDDRRFADAVHLWSEHAHEVNRLILRDLEARLARN